MNLFQSPMINPGSLYNFSMICTFFGFKCKTLVFKILYINLQMYIFSGVSLVLYKLNISNVLYFTIDNKNKYIKRVGKLTLICGKFKQIVQIEIKELMLSDMTEKEEAITPLSSALTYKILNLLLA